MDLGTVAVIGLGLTGGSLARDLAAADVPVIGYDHDHATLTAAFEAGVIARALDPTLHGLEDARVVVLAVPVDAAAEVLRRAAPRLIGARLITDVGSTKAGIVAAAEAAGLADRFVGGHPLTGDDRTGWQASRAGLFAGARVFLCPTPASSDGAIESAERLWTLVGAHPLRMAADDHDRRLAWTSHLPQTLASALAIALMDAHLSRGDLGPGGRGMTRLAASSPPMWAAIATENASAIASAIDGVEGVLERFRDALASHDRRALDALFEAGRSWAAAPDGEPTGPPEPIAGQAVAFQGELGAHSEEAVRAFFPDPVRPLPCREFQDVATAVASGRAQFGLLPVENSTAGSVVAAYDVLARSGLEVVGEVVRPIRHCLLGLPGASVGQVRRVLSHPVALAQCGRFLAQRRWIEATASYDTAGAAREVAAADDPALAAIAGRHAAAHYGLEVLAADVQDRPDNRTRFLVLAAPDARPPATPPGPVKSALFIDVADRPGALADVLLPFARRDVNLSHIQSTPGDASWTYRFIVELDADATTGPAADAMADARALGADIRILGRYPPVRRRRTED